MEEAGEGMRCQKSSKNIYDSLERLISEARHMLTVWQGSKVV